MTFQACSIQEARFLYDQLAVVTPIVVSAKEKSPCEKCFFIFRLLMSWLCQQFCLCILIHNFSLDFISCTSCSVDIAVSFYNLLFVF